MARKQAKKSFPVLPIALGAIIAAGMIVSWSLVAHIQSEHHQDRARLGAQSRLPEAQAQAPSPAPAPAGAQQPSPVQAVPAVSQPAQVDDIPVAKEQEEQEELPEEVDDAAGEEEGKDAEAAHEEQPEAGGNSNVRIEWKQHRGKSCQGYANDDTTIRTLEASKRACLKNEACVAIECPSDEETQCTLRANTILVPFREADCYEQLEMSPDGKILSVRVHPNYQNLIKEYPFQPVTTQHGQQVNIILVRSHMSQHQIDLYHQHKDEILFLGISSMNDYPLHSEGDHDTTDWVGMFPGFLHMMRNPEKHFPPHVKTLLMSQSDFSLPNYPERDYSKPRKWDFTYSGSDCDVLNDCHGWCGWSKNFSFVREALQVMCSDEFKLKGVLVATKDKSGKHACSIPKACEGKITQTTYLQDQRRYFEYLKESRFAFLPQVHDASPRVSTQALALDVPILMNWYISGGWKYVNETTGEYFHDMSDFKDSLRKILRKSDEKFGYQPRKWVFENYGNEKSGKRLYDFVMTNFGDRVKLPRGTKALLP